MRAYRAYKPPKAARSPPRAASTSEESPMASGAGVVVTARQSLIVRRESTVVPACAMPTPDVIPVCKTWEFRRTLTRDSGSILWADGSSPDYSLVQLG